MKNSIVLCLLMLGGLVYAESPRVLDKLLTEGNTAYPFSYEAKLIINCMSHEDKVACAKNLFSKMKDQEAFRQSLGLHSSLTIEEDRKKFLENTHPDDGKKIMYEWDQKAIKESARILSGLRFSELKQDSEKTQDDFIFSGFGESLQTLRMQHLLFDVRDREAQNKDAVAVKARKAIEQKIADEAKVERERAGIQHRYRGQFPIPCCR